MITNVCHNYIKQNTCISVDLNLQEDFSDFFGEDINYVNPMQLIGFGSNIFTLAENLLELNEYIKEKFQVEGATIFLDGRTSDEQNFKFSFNRHSIPFVDGKPTQHLQDGRFIDEKYNVVDVRSIKSRC